MRTLTHRKYGVVLLAAVFLAATAGVASSVTYTLRVGVDNLVMPDNAVIPVWKIARVDTDNVLRFPGPTLVGTVGDNLVITLVNGLPSDNTPVGTGNGISLVIPGLGMPVVENPAGSPLPQQGPVFVTPVVDNISLPPRAVSYTQMTPAANGTRTYRFALSKPGTFLYQSGADPSVQVQMGIYGAVIVRPAGFPTVPGQAYDNAATAFDTEAVLLYSAIDPFLHNAVTDNTLGTEAFPSTFRYEPKYFLINGKPFQNQLDPLVQHHDPLPIGSPAGNGTLLRFLNADLAAHAPSFPDTYVSVIGEDGNLLPYPRVHHSLLLTAGKTLDVILVPSAPARKIPVIDRRLFVNNNGVYPGGHLAFLGVQGADVSGPATSFTSFTPDPSTGISPVLLTATAADNAAGNSNVVAAEWITKITVREGYGNPMTGTFGSAVVSDLAAYIPLSAIPADNALWIRSQDSEGNWSLPVPVAAAKGATAPLAIVQTDFVGGERLIVRATSNAPAGTATLTVTWTGAPGPVPLVYRSGLALYEAEVLRVPAKPDTVTVTGAGVSATAPVPFP
jgi:hypothetical protein